MARDPLDREYGMLLGIAGPILLDRIDSYKRLAKLLGPGAAATWLEAQAERMEHTLRTIGRKFDEQHRT